MVALPAPMAAVRRYLWGVNACKLKSVEFCVLTKWIFETLTSLSSLTSRMKFFLSWGDPPLLAGYSQSRSRPEEDDDDDDGGGNPPFLGRLASRILKIPSKLCFWRKSMVLLTNFCLFFLSFAIPLYFVLPSFQPPMAIMTWGARLENNRLDAKESRWHLLAVFWNCFGLYSVQVKISLHFCFCVLDFIPLSEALLYFSFWIHLQVRPGLPEVGGLLEAGQAVVLLQVHPCVQGLDWRFCSVETGKALKGND